MTNILLSFSDVMTTVGYVAIAILVLMLMITVHEAGHYFVGKILKFSITEFSIGMGPAIFKRKMKSGETFSIRALPLGGYCAFDGEDKEGATPDAFNNKAPWKRILVLVAGATMNYLLALLIIIISMNVYGQSTLGVQVARGTAGEEAVYEGASLEDGDYIISITRGGKKSDIYMATDLVNCLNGAKSGEVVDAEVIRGENRLIQPVKLRSDVDCASMTEVNKTYAALGFGSAMKLTVSESSAFKTGDYLTRLADDETEYKESFIFDERDIIRVVGEKQPSDEISFYVSRDGEKIKLDFVFGESWQEVDKTDINAIFGYFGIEKTEKVYYTDGAYRKAGFFRSLSRSLGYSFRIGGTIFRTLGELITGRIGLNAMGGTVTTIITATQVMRYGAVYALEIAAFIGVNLAVFNLLPIPALDGSKIVFCLIEWVRGKPINRKIEGMIHTIGFVFILAFAVLVDLLHLF
ncbi:MAG: RIP metalloprotease RseP [Clostridia bacterium]|nr:RIP metalloprotease RseP [Clostridia bacterium]